MNGFITIPHFLTIEEHLTLDEAYILSLVYSLNKSFDVAVITNQKVAKRINKSKRTVNRIIENLIEQEYLIRENTKTKRILTLDENIMTKIDNEIQRANKTHKTKKKDVNVDWFEDYKKSIK